MKNPSTLPDDIRQHLEAENTYMRSVLAPTESLQETLFEEMKGRIKEEDESTPAPDGPFFYYTRTREGGQHFIYARRARTGSGQEKILLDGDKEAAPHDYFRISACDHGPDHTYIAWGVDTIGGESYTVHIYEAAKGKAYGESIKNTSGDFVWAADGRTIFYTRLDDNHRPSRVFRHHIGDNPADDYLVYEEPDPGFFVSLSKTQSGDFILIDSHDHTTSEVRLIDAHNPAGSFVLVEPRKSGLEYSLEHDRLRNRFLVLTNADGAEDFKICEVDVSHPARSGWRDIVLHTPGRLILEHICYAGHMAHIEQIDGLPRLIITDLKTGDMHPVAFEEDAYDLDLMSGLEYGTQIVRFCYDSMTTPVHVYDYDMGTRQRTLLKVQEIPAGHDPNSYCTRRLMAQAEDGERIPISLLYHKDTPLDGSAPVLLYGYGAYGITIPASFSTTRFSLTDRGFIYAIAHIRGGMERGYHWYMEGRGNKKTNTFRDFIAVAHHLVSEGLTREGALTAHGGSAGGLLMGAVANRAPHLFCGIIAEVPFVDVLTTMLDETLPLTPPEWPEWGNPITDKVAYEVIASYSPVDNVEKQAYPHIFATGGLTDPRVCYWEPAKWVARLRAARSDNGLTLLHMNMGAGHGGASGRFDRLKEVARLYAFALMIHNRMETMPYSKD